MRRRGLSELAIYELQEETERIEGSLLLDLYLEKTSDTVYFTLEGKLYGIVCLNDLLDRMEDGIVPVNRRFSKMNCFDEEQARKIFSQKKFTKIPVVDAGNHLFGDYTNLDGEDRIFVEWLTSWKCVWTHLKKHLKDEDYKKVYVINPVAQKQYLRTHIEQIFESVKVPVTFIEIEQINLIQINNERNLVITTDLEELRCIQCRNTILQTNSNSKCKYMTITSLWNRVARFARDRRYIHYGEVIDPIIGKNLLPELQNRGVNILTIYNDTYYVSDYIKDLFQKNLYHKKNYGNNRFWPVESDIGKEFFGELLENEDYRNGIAQSDIKTGDLSLSAGYSGKYYNKIDGYRKTCYQPDEYYGTIYLFGPCLIRGSRVEDKYTMASQLQKKLNDEGYPYLVVNRGRALEESVFQEMCKTVFHRGDIIIIYTGFNTYENIESVEIRRVFEENKVPTGWFKDLPIHMNHKATGLMAILLYDKLKKYLISENREAEKKEDIVIGMEIRSRILKKLTKEVYLNAWFGSINCQVIRGGMLADYSIEPFMLEHVLPDIFNLVEELIVFVVTAGNCLYTWREYVAAILKMSSTEHKIRVVPGDNFVPYRSLLPSYYSDDALTKEAVVEESKFFAECIAEPLNINYRFGFGSSTSKKLTQYNQILKEELPKLGIQYIELK